MNTWMCNTAGHRCPRRLASPGPGQRGGDAAAGPQAQLGGLVRRNRLQLSCGHTPCPVPFPGLAAQLQVGVKQTIPGDWAPADLQLSCRTRGARAPSGSREAEGPHLVEEADTPGPQGRPKWEGTGQGGRTWRHSPHPGFISAPPGGRRSHLGTGTASNFVQMESLSGASSPGTEQATWPGRSVQSTQPLV